jgi:hypothetical protein
MRYMHNVNGTTGTEGMAFLFFLPSYNCAPSSDDQTHRDVVVKV